MTADWLTYAAFSAGWSAVRHMSEKQAYASFNTFADQAWKRRGRAVVQLEKNLRRVVPSASHEEIRELSRADFRSYARYWCEAFRMPDWSAERIRSFRVDGLEHLDAALDAGHAPVIVVPHAGNYDAGGAFLAARSGGITTVAERLKPKKLYDKFVAFRTRLGMEVLAQDGEDVFGTLVKRTGAGRLVALVGDRDLSRHGIPVSFFGEPTRMPAGPALLARRTGSPLLVGSFWLEDGRNRAKVFPPVHVDPDGDEGKAVAAATQRAADLMAEGIRAHPSDWHMLQPLWLADLDPKRDPMRRSEESDHVG